MVKRGYRIINKRTLYQCLNARVQGNDIRCRKGHPFPNFGNKISTLRLARGDALQLSICQECNDYDHMGEPIIKEERGWLF